jgi:hypothetical protein
VRLGLGAAATMIVTLVMLITAASVVARHASALTPTPRATSSMTERSSSTVTETPTSATTIVTATATATRAATRPPTPVGTHLPPPPYHTPTPIPGLNFWIAVDGVPACSSQHGNATCYISPGSTFVINVYLDPLPPEIRSYGGFDIALDYVGVTPNYDASTDAWPDCAFPASAYDSAPNRVVFGCAVGVPPAGGSTYSGLIGTSSFVCSDSGSVSLVPGVFSTDLVEFDNIANIDAEDIHTSDKLTINCAQSPALPPAGVGRAQASRLTRRSGSSNPDKLRQRDIDPAAGEPEVRLEDEAGQPRALRHLERQPAADRLAGQERS